MRRSLLLATPFALSLSGFRGVVVIDQGFFMLLWKLMVLQKRPPYIPFIAALIFLTFCPICCRMGPWQTPLVVVSRAQKRRAASEISRRPLLA